MVKKVKEYKAGDFIFAKVKGYPAWPARVQRLNGKKYFVYFYGTGETANLPPNMIFDYAENKDKFLTKTVKRRDFNDGVKQIEHDFANNVPLEEVIGVLPEAPADTTANDTVNDTANDTMNDSAVGDSTLDETANDTTAAINETGVEDSDENASLVIDEGKKGKKKVDPTKTPSKETPKPKDAKTPRGRAKKEEAVEKKKEEQKKEEEIVSRSGRKIRPKKFVDEQTEENTTLPSPVAKKRRGGSPPPEKEKENAKEKDKKDGNKIYNKVSQSELEDLKEPFVPADPEKQNILITHLPSGQYVGLKLFQSSPSAVTNFKNDGVKLLYDKQQAKNALTLKAQLERGQITPQSIAAQLIMDLNLTDEEKATLDKERETEEKKSRVQFLKTEMKLIELDAKIKTCLCLEKADTELCLKLLDELQELNLKPLMLLKHPTCVETVKRMRAYVGNTPSWGLNENESLEFAKRAASIRKQCDAIYNDMKELFTVPDGLSFWEFFSERVLQFKKATSKLNADELLELVHEPLEMTLPTSHTMKSAIDAANEQEKQELAAVNDTSTKRKTPAKKKKEAAVEKSNSTPAKSDTAPEKDSQKEKEKENEKEKEKEKEKPLTKSKKDAKDATQDKPSTPSKPTIKRQSSRNKPTEEKPKEQPESTPEPQPEPQATEAPKTPPTVEPMETDAEEPTNNDEQPNNNQEQTESSNQEPAEPVQEETTTDVQPVTENNETPAETENSEGAKESNGEGAEESETKDEGKQSEKETQDKEADDEPRAKRSRESKKTEAPPPRSPAKRKTKA